MDVVSLLCEIVRFDTRNPGGDEPALARALAERLAAFAPDQLDVRDVARAVGPPHTAYVLARWGRPRVLLNAHLDTVPANAGWSGDPHTPRLVDGRIIGLGAADTKGAIAAILCALERVRPTNLAVLFSGDEEAGGACVRDFVASPHARGLERAVVCEPTSLRMGVRHRGILTLAATRRGEGGHSSRADALPAPLADLARLAVQLHGWGVARRDLGPAGYRGMCLNVAQLSGGVAFNVVPSEGRLVVSLRPPPGSDADAIRAELEALCHATLGETAVDWPNNGPALATRDPRSFQPLLGAVADAPVDLGFWTEAAVLSPAGIDAVVVGPGDIAMAHAPDESLACDELTRAVDLYETVVREAG